jgi:hypothetical protein
MASRPREIPYPDVKIDLVRALANRRANATSIRRLAAEVGLLHSTVDKFLRGAEPHFRLRAVWCAWYLGERAKSPVAVQAVAAGASRREPQPLAVEEPEHHLNSLLVELRGDAASEARLRITRALAQAYQRMGLREPEWLYRGR